MALKTEIQCATCNKVGFTRTDLTYQVDGETRYVRVALYNAGGTFISVDQYNVNQFGSLTPDTDYILRSVYFDEDGLEVEGIIPNTEVQFKTKKRSDYTPVIQSTAGGVISIAELLDSKFIHPQAGITGFGIGVELCDANYNILASSTETPCVFDSYTGTPAYVRAFYWTGQQAISSRLRQGAVTGATATVTIEQSLLSVFAFPESNKVELHVRLEGYDTPSELSIYLDETTHITTITDGLQNNKVYVIIIDELDSETEYTIDAYLSYRNGSDSTSIDFTTLEARETSSRDPQDKHFKDFWIAVGEPGAYSKDMVYHDVFGVNERFGIKIKHAPYSPMAHVKNMVVQSWKDEDGDDVWLPRRTGSQAGTYEPAVTHEAVDYTPRFVIFGSVDKVNSNTAIKEFIKSIEGRWLKIWDDYTQMGYEGVYLIDVDDDPKFKRRSYDYVDFELKFKINGPNIDAPFYDLGEATISEANIASDDIELPYLESDNEGYVDIEDTGLTPTD